MPYPTNKEPGTRKSRVTGNYVTPQRATLDGMYDTFARMSEAQQATSLEVFTQLHRQRKILGVPTVPEKQQTLPESQ